MSLFPSVFCTISAFFLMYGLPDAFFLLVTTGWIFDISLCKNSINQSINQSDIRTFGIVGDWKATAFKAEMWVETVAEGGQRFMAAWRKEEVDAARHRQEKREAAREGNLLLHTEA